MVMKGSTQWAGYCLDNVYRGVSIRQILHHSATTNNGLQKGVLVLRLDLRRHISCFFPTGFRIWKKIWPKILGSRSNSARNEHFCHFSPFLGHFRSLFRSPMYFMHSNVYLRYLIGAGIYFKCLWPLYDQIRASRGFKRAPNWAYLPFLPQFGTFLAQIKIIHVSNAFKSFPEVPVRYFLLFQLLLDTTWPIQGL